MPVTISGTNGITYPDGNIQSQASVSTEIGSIVFTTSSTPPTSSYLQANGAVISISSYSSYDSKVPSNSALRNANTPIIDRYGGTTAPAGTTYTADSTIDAGRGPSAAFDGANGDAANCWHSTNHGPPYWIRVTFSSAVRLNYWDWQKRNDNTNYPLNWTLRGSNNGGTTYDTLYTKTGDGGVNAGSFNINTFTNNANSYTTYEMNIGASSSNAYCIVGEIRCGSMLADGLITLPNYTSLPAGLYAHIKVL